MTLSTLSFENGAFSTSELNQSTGDLYYIILENE